MQQTQFLRMLYYSTVSKSFRSYTTRMVAFMEFFHINEVVMWFINKIVILYKKIK